MAKKELSKAQPVSETIADQPVSIPLDPSTAKIRVELGFVFSSDKGSSTLKSKIEEVRDNIYATFGINIPPVVVVDNAKLSFPKYRIMINNKEVANGEIGNLLGNSLVLAVDTGSATVYPYAKEATYFESGTKAWWISPSQENVALSYGYTVMNNPSVIANHLKKAIIENMPEIVKCGETIVSSEGVLMVHSEV